MPYVKLDGPELWEIVFGVNSDAATEITDAQYDQIAKHLNEVFISPKQPAPSVAVEDLTAEVQDVPEERYRHKKRGSIYTVTARGRLQVDGDLDNEKVVIYRGEDGLTWVRPEYEFNDGRFEPLPAAPAKQEGGK
ncbi:hypothetical protein [Agrobacterium tumefaciens]|uniref:hypothetical protein n=1 Tax=Agrobacterium tumefaciens TaxID=358 RepID=UPI001AECE4F5|nr:hypothetical protein [Agrobacterium tumefaciens]WIC84667.1 hypothetical protein A6U93_00575 [Agrobacterium tumefaciens]